MIKKKKCQIYASLPITCFEVPIVGETELNLTEEEIYKCLCAKAEVLEILSNGKRVNLDFTNYNKTNEPVVTPISAVEEIPEPIIEEVPEPAVIEEVKEEIIEPVVEPEVVEEKVEEEVIEESVVEDKVEPVAETVKSYQVASRNNNYNNNKKKNKK